jgi:hypothetical protein
LQQNNNTNYIVITYRSLDGSNMNQIIAFSPEWIQNCRFYSLFKAHNPASEEKKVQMDNKTAAVHTFGHAYPA